MWSIFPRVNSFSGFRNNSQDHRRLYDQLFEPQAAIGKPEQASRRVLLEGFSQLVSDIRGASRNFTLIYYNNTAKILKTISGNKKVL
jgi:hypothetical protein